MTRGDLEGGRRAPRENPVERANLISQLFLVWIIPKFFEGSRKPLTQRDIDDPPSQEESYALVTKLQRNWEAEHQNALKNAKNGIPEAVVLLMQNGGGEPTATIQMNGQKEQNGHAGNDDKEKKGPPGDYKLIFRALMSTFKVEYFTLWPSLMFTDCILKVAQPLFLLWLIRSFMTPSTFAERCFYAGGVCLVTFLITVTYVPLQFRLGRISMRIRIALSSLVQRKMMRLSGVSYESKGDQVTSGSILTLVMNDCATIERSLRDAAPYVIISVVQLAIFIVCLWVEFGTWSTISGVGFVIFFAIFLDWYGSKSGALRESIGKHTGERTQNITEVIEGINTIKTNAWEDIFKKIVNKCRKSEIGFIFQRSMLHAFFMAIFLTSSRLAPFLSFMVFVLSGGPLTADRVFFAVAVYNTMTHYVGWLLPSSVRGIGEIQGSLRRIQKFLLTEERNEQANECTHSSKSGGGGHPRISINSVSALWPNKNKALDSITLSFDKPQLIVVVGPSGSGKTALMNLLLGELPIISGHCALNGIVSYASQIPWLFNGSIRDNILLRTQFDDARYRAALFMSGLAEDIKEFKHKDQHLVGENGSALSGGQKSRVNLARCLYREADIYLIDDPLSKLDSRISRHIFEKGLKEGLSKKLRIVVANQPQFLSQADLIIVVKDGTISATGTYPELVQEGHFDSNAIENSDGDVDSLVEGNAPLEMLRPNDITLSDVPVEAEEEEQRQGSTKWATYWQYFMAASSPTTFALYVLLFIVSQIFATFIEFWVVLWTNYEQSLISGFIHNETDSNSNFTHSLNGGGGVTNSVEEDELPSDIYTSTGSTFLHIFQTHTGIELNQNVYLIIYAILTALVLLTNLAKAFGFFEYCVRICKNIHTALISSLMRAQPGFFDAPKAIGRITNRCTRDIQELDEALPFAFFDMLTIFLQIGTVVILILYSIQSWWFLGGVAVFFLALWFVRSFYVSTSRELKRIEANARSPIGSELSSCYSGLVTIRAQDAVDKFTVLFDGYQDNYTAASFTFWACNKSFDMWIEFIATGLLIAVTFGFLIAQHYFDMSFPGGNVGLAICNAMSLTNWLSYGMRTSANVTNCMISAERTLEYTNLESEADEITSQDKSLPQGWPTEGRITFSSVILQYIKGKNVLDGISFSIASGERIGVVGKTGAGKSSVLRAFLRLTESEGDIKIDSEDIRKLGLKTLRCIISIIPQEPVLFTQTLRFNLDPTKQTKDVEMKEVLKKVKLGKKLDELIENSGRNLSVGERQLVALARALLQNRQIVAMDEATAQLDPETDENIQKTLHEHQQSRRSTTITIAHKLNTVINYDKILVLSDGHVQEFDEPHILLKSKDSALAKLVDASGPKIANQLRTKAKSAYDQKHAGRMELQKSV